MGSVLRVRSLEGNRPSNSYFTDLMDSTSQIANITQVVGEGGDPEYQIDFEDYAPDIPIVIAYLELFNFTVMPTEAVAVR